MRQINPKQQAAVSALPGQQRFEHFVKVVADSEEAWGLYQEGWALAAADDGTTVFPLWPAKEYADACAVSEWQGYEPVPIALDRLMGERLPKLKADGVLPGVFFTPSSKGVTPSVDELLRALNEELENY
jgi:hypothetical protein